MQLPVGAEVMVAGDMHGSVENLRLLLKGADLARQPRRHLVLQELVHGPFRYPGGGDKSHQLLDLLAALKCQYPERIHFLLGNHELAQWQNQRIGKGDIDQNDLFRDGIGEAYGAAADSIYAAYLQLFEAANALVRTDNRVILTHSVPPARRLAAFNMEKVRREALEPEDVALGGWLHSLVWGRDTSAANVRAFLDKVDGDLLLSGHIPCEQGYSVPNEYQIILDALGTPACYCIFPTDGPMTHARLLEGIRVL
ncbi:MAG: metallophosphoesterase [Gemmataceae bacterium]